MSLDLAATPLDLKAQANHQVKAIEAAGVSP
jgi:hypothetical protein